MGYVNPRRGRSGARLRSGVATREANETVRSPDEGRRTARRRRQLGLLAAAGLAAAALGFAAHASGALERLDLSSYDARLALGGPSASLDRVVVVAIDEETQRELRRAFPFSRKFHAQAIDRLRAAGPRAIAYDIQFTEPKSAAEDLPLLDAVARAKGRIVLATAEVGPGGETSVLGGEPVLRDLGVSAADSNLPFDSDGVIRRMSYAPHGLKTLAVRAVEMTEGRPVDKAQFEGGDPWINFQGAPGTVKTVSFADLLARRVPEVELRGKVVVVGATDRVIQDVHRTAASGTDLMAGPEIQANAVATALDGFPLGRGTGGLAPVLILLMAAVGPLAAAALAPTRMLLACAAALVLFLVAAQLAFNGGTVVAVAAPLLALVAGTGASFAVKYFT